MNKKQRDRIMKWQKANPPCPLRRWSDKSKRNDRTRWQIMPRTPEMTQVAPELDGKIMTYGRSGAFMTDDGGVARALQQKYGKRQIDVWEVKDNEWHDSDKGHKYIQKGVALPWHSECKRCGRKAEGELCSKCVEELGGRENVNDYDVLLQK